ncbi:GTPase Era [Neptunomonas phycophila]|jgi:GTP-binding protein Era|uniref:GTPase Era n=1 Tax=Neptunomonas phycophila TaxID=1572645 RepID=A0AAW7XFU1_9GAMM|nr:MULTISPECIES: GTPase Era [Neptunomonas]MDN2658514.1 GTPase Era [Neptunomonas sp. CHC150]MDO6452915.1 GTPase Era [Neptunomonas phycophila]MDO6467439.1 GTPase Era [Neptunomonas phycophila]MDP2521453.1 GTPase Era [Neptunomonas phycophila]QLE98540.1 GTPase Era [Neptunomonas phycophila]
MNEEFASWLTPEGSDDQRCGFVAIVGRPNMGKSTLMNYMLGQKISITSKKPQTTRHQILGIKTEGDLQIVFVDTPGLHKEQDKALNRYMNKAASEALRGVDLVLFMVDRTAWTEEDDIVLGKVQHAPCPVILVVNKVDQLEDKNSLLPQIAHVSEKMKFADIIPISAKNGTNVDQLENLINQYMPQSAHHYPEDQITDKSSRFMVAEIVREKLMRNVGDEVPYGATVEIEEFINDGRLLTISALVLVEREGQKKIIIGEKGERMKTIGRDARKDIEALFETKVMLNLWVKVRRGWSDDERALKSLGYQHGE